MKVLVLGSSGQLGMSANLYLDTSSHNIIFASKEEIDITNLDDINSKLQNFSPDLICNLSAYTNVDEAEVNLDEANRVNNTGVENLAHLANKLNCWLIHISTDYVFDGSQISSYKENDKTNPLGVYGLTKLEGEKKIITSSCKYIIIRTSWIFGEYGNNFLKTMLDLALKKEEISIVNDQIGCPTYSHDLINAINQVIHNIEHCNVRSGIYHFSGYPSCTWYEFAKSIFNEAKHYNFKVPKLIKPIKTEEFFRPAKRPTCSILNCEKIYNDFKISQPKWKLGLQKAIKNLAREI
tara:strand:+ start:16565 stop:17446 length:882 start_codon:yes stop_codon:yes gene_type:complete